ncbi:SgcJ/EcaC family oxidoreductase [Kitasatospora sp. HPMI-4]|uniref:SgcJ/EcaC family oxidoreductase n=1 Tax=Kitasatospora sp. HPMI-4 TaxID=3448443 RepID=UPI003F1981E0
MNDTSKTAATAKEAVAVLPQRIIAAWAKHDAEAFAAVFTEDATMVLPGVYCKGQAAIRSFLDDAFRGAFKGTRVTGTPIDLRFLSESAAVLVTEGGVLAPGESTVHPDRKIRASWIAVRNGDQWRLAAYQNSPFGEV